MNEAALLAARRGRDVVAMSDFEDSKDKVLMGAERRSMIISENETNLAYHEAGHAGRASPPEHRPGTQGHDHTSRPSAGYTQRLPSEDRLSMTRDYAENRIAILMGGRVAEEVIFDQITTGAGQDIDMATGLARKMVCEWG